MITTTINETRKRGAPIGNKNAVKIYPAESEALRSKLFAERRMGAEVARELGLSRERVSQWKRGETKIPPRYHQAVEAILERRDAEKAHAKKRADVRELISNWRGEG